VADHSDLEAALRTLGRHLDVPPAPDVTFAVRSRLQAPAPRRAPVLRPAIVILLLLLAAVVVAVPPVRAAVVEFFRIGGVQIQQGSGPAVPSTPVRTGRLVADLDEARRLTGVRARPPELLGRPDEIRVIGGRVVSLGYRPAADRPAIRLDVLDGTIDPAFRKYLYIEEATEVDVGGVPGWFIPRPHEIVQLDPDGVERPDSARLAAPTLVWHRAGTTYRLEAALPLARLITIAGSIPR
jgi:hypothetical protein